ncbi:MAG: ribonuclease H-like domain-containing protein [Deltaproteobacteria bacterium]|nr:ribonuclease H-like domain-containing protein [Deltaproteobacteria bacterium]
MAHDSKKYIVLDIETTGLLPWYGDRITCICAKDSDGKKFSSTRKDERALIDSFLEWLNAKHGNKHYLLITKNGKCFDIPFIMARIALMKELTEAEKAILNCDHFDLEEITYGRISLNDTARLLKCTPKSGTGEHAIELWEEGRYHELKAYCMQDVETTEEVYLKWLGL